MDKDDIKKALKEMFKSGEIKFEREKHWNEWYGWVIERFIIIDGKKIQIDVQKD